MTNQKNFPANQERILFTGPTGVDQATVMDNLKEHIIKEARLYQKERDVKCYSLEDFLPEDVGVPDLMDSGTTRKIIQSKWRDAQSVLRSKVKEEDARIALISLHATWYRSSRISTPVDLTAISSLKPSSLVTLVDDLYSIWHRVVLREQHKEEKGGNRRQKTRSYFTLAEICNWRWAEVMASDLIAQALNKENYVIAVKHPVSMLYRLLFERTSPLLYACIPISETRKTEEGRKEINHIRRQLHQKFIVFDPLTLDDKVLAILLDKKFGFRQWHGADQRTLYGQELEILEAVGNKPGRWPYALSDEGPLKSLCTDPPGRITLDAGEVAEISRARRPGPKRRNLSEVQDSVIDDHIRLRDYRLIEDSDGLAGYRPQYKKKAPGGQIKEIQFAVNLAGQKKYHIVVYHSKSRGDGPLQGGPFANLPEEYCEFRIDEWWKHLRSFCDGKT